ncbi:uncharacterized protein LOC113777402 [Coffea eugenioides]|uniref:uncharacterized protein LOC113777402 n=1 Tax=Coffea eugenioides TaxID=49369 RepID=UPI000F60AA72|nr:uncharacterized protein LOC113777402 [Coffea eugenioides]
MEKIEGGRVASEITDSDHRSNPSLQCSVNLQDQESAVNTINEGQCLENGGISTHAANGEAGSSNHTTYEEVYGYRPYDESSALYWGAVVKRYEKLRARIPETKTYRTFQSPYMTISHLVTCFSIEDLSRNAEYGWKVERLTNEGVRLRFKRLIRKEEAGISEDLISRRLRTTVYAPSANGSLSEGSPGSTDKQENCCICAEKYQTNDSIAGLYYCEHHFHADCIKKWLREKNTCPCADH